MEDMTSSRLALRSLLKDSKDKRATSTISQDRAKVPVTPSANFDVPETDEKRKEQLKLGRVMFEFFEQKPPAPSIDETFPVKGKGRPTKAQAEKAKNITICLSVKHIDLLDNVNFSEKNTKGRGRKVRFLMDSYLKHQKREKEQLRSVQESLRLVANNIDTFSKNYKRAEKFSENERTMTDLEKAISNLRIILSLLKIETSDLKKNLSEKEWSTYQFALSWISNKAGDQ
jgi:hypothetical protein